MYYIVLQCSVLHTTCSLIQDLEKGGQNLRIFFNFGGSNSVTLFTAVLVTYPVSKIWLHRTFMCHKINLAQKSNSCVGKENYLGVRLI